MSYSEIEHFATMVSGCEDYTSGNKNTPNATYAFAVLKLHAQDLGFVAGTEGFLDSIKKGAANVKEWLLKLIRGMVNFLKGSSSKRTDSKTADELENEFNEKAPGQYREFVKEVFGDKYSKIRDDLIKNFDEDKNTAFINDSSTRVYVDVSSYKTKLDDAIKEIEMGKRPSKDWIFNVLATGLKRDLLDTEKYIKKLGPEEPVPGYIIWFVNYAKLIIESSERMERLNLEYDKKASDYLKKYFTNVV